MPETKEYLWITEKDIAEMSKYVKPEVVEAYLQIPRKIVEFQTKKGDTIRAEVPMVAYQTDPYSWRYGEHEMRVVMSEGNKHQLLLDAESGLISGHADLGAVSRASADDVVSHASIKYVTPEEVWAREQFDTKHDIQAVNDALAAVCLIGGQDTHLGATSNDKIDNAWAVILERGCQILKQKNMGFLSAMYDRVVKMKEDDVVGSARTHRQIAIPIAYAHKFANHMDDIIEDVKRWDAIIDGIKAKGYRGAVGTSASFVQVYEKPETLSKFLQTLESGELETIAGTVKIEEIVNDNKMRKKMAKYAADKLNSVAMDHFRRITNSNVQNATTSRQIVSRRGLAEIYNQIMQMVETADNFAYEVVDLQRTEIWELVENFDPSQYASSTMPGKKNPTTSENIQGQARLLRSFASQFYENRRTAHERDLINTPFERMISTVFLAADEAMVRSKRLVQKLYVNKERIEDNAKRNAYLLNGERLIMELKNRGYGRHEAHKSIREASLEILEKQHNQDFDAVEIFSKYIPEDVMNKDEIETFLDPRDYIGCSYERVDDVLRKAESVLQKSKA